MTNQVPCDCQYLCRHHPELNRLRAENERLRAAVSKCTGELGCEAYKLARGADEPGDGAVVMRPYPYTICNAKSPLECERQPDGHCAKCSPERTTSGIPK